MSIGTSKNKLKQSQVNQNHNLRMKRKLQVLFLVVSIMSTSVMIGCSNKNIEQENSTVTEDQDSVEEGGTSDPTTTPSGEGEENQQEQDNQPTDDNTSEQGDGETGSSSEEGSGNQTGETSENDSSQSDSSQDKTDPFFETEEGSKVYDVADAFAKAYLNQKDDVATTYMAKDAPYEALDGSYSNVELLELKFFSYDETTKEAYVSYTFVGNGEDSYTYLSMELVSEEGDYKVSMYGLEK